MRRCAEAAAVQDRLCAEALRPLFLPLNVRSRGLAPRHQFWPMHLHLPRHVKGAPRIQLLHQRRERISVRGADGIVQNPYGKTSYASIEQRRSQISPAMRSAIYGKILGERDRLHRTCSRSRQCLLSSQHDYFDLSTCLSCTDVRK